VIGERGTPVRRAALLLHAMVPADRDWVLGQLPASGRERLRELLRELVELGIPRDATLLSQVVSAPSAAREPILDVEVLPDARAGATPAETVAAADPARLATLLRGEPVELVALLLSLRDWTWRDAFLRQIGPVMARQVAERQVAAGGGIGGAGEDVLLAVLVRRLRDMPVAMAPQATVRALPAPAAARGATPGRGWLGQVMRLRARGQAR